MTRIVHGVINPAEPCPATAGTQGGNYSWTAGSGSCCAASINRLRNKLRCSPKARSAVIRAISG